MSDPVPTVPASPPVAPATPAPTTPTPGAPAALPPLPPPAPPPLEEPVFLATSPADPGAGSEGAAIRGIAQATGGIHAVADLTVAGADLIYSGRNLIDAWTGSFTLGVLRSLNEQLLHSRDMRLIRFLLMLLAHGIDVLESLLNVVSHARGMSMIHTQRLLAGRSGEKLRHLKQRLHALGDRVGRLNPNHKGYQANLQRLVAERDALSRDLEQMMSTIKFASEEVTSARGEWERIAAGRLAHFARYAIFSS